MRRGAAGVLALALGFASPAPAAEPPVPAVSVTFPEGWRVAERDGFLSARHPSDRARCNRDIVRSPPLDAMSASELEAEITRPWDAAAWAGLMGAPVDRLTVVATEAAPAGPRQVRTGTLRIHAGATPVTRKDVHARIAVQLLPGYVVIAACYAPVEHWPAMRGAMEAAVGSLRVE